jgi:LysR family transcriptional regulator AphB
MRRQSGQSGTRRAARGTIEAPPPATLDDLAVFVSVAEHASFAEASRRLALPTSSVSRAVARLEEAIGAPLLRRTSRKVVTTDEGRRLLLHSTASIASLREALSTAADRRPEPSGIVRVTAPAFTGATRVARSLTAFALAHPKIAIELDATNATRDLLRDGYDFGIRVGPNADADFVARRLWQGRFGLVAARSFVEKAFRGRLRITREELEHAPAVALRKSVVWRFRRPNGETVEIAPRACFTVNDPRVAADVARRGLGVALLPAEAAAEAPELVSLETDFGEPTPVDLFVVYPTKRLLPARVRLAIEWLAREEPGT